MQAFPLCGGMVWEEGDLGTEAGLRGGPVWPLTWEGALPALGWGSINWFQCFLLP